MSLELIPFIEDTQDLMKAITPGLRPYSLATGATNNGLTIANDVMTPTGDFGYLLKQISRINLDRLIFPKIYTGTGHMARVDVCGALILNGSSTDENLRTVGSAISSPDNPSYPKANLYDNNLTYPTGVCSLTTPAGSLSGVAYIGKDFGTIKTVSRCKYWNYEAIRTPDSVLVQISDDNINWETIQTQAITTTNATPTSFTITTPKPSRYFRLLANANTANGWEILELELYSDQIVVFDDATHATFVNGSAVDGYYVGDILTIDSGTGAYQSRVIKAYNGTTKQATFDAWTTTPTGVVTATLYDGIATNAQPGFDFQTIDYTEHPTVNVLCSLEKGTGAASAPSMGVPVYTKLTTNTVQRGTGTGTLSSSQLTVNVTLTTPVSMTNANVMAWVRSTSATAYTCDVVPTLTSETNLELKFSGSNASAPIAYTWEVVNG